MLDKPIQRDGETDQNGDGDDPVELPLGPHTLEHEKEDDDVGQSGVGPLQPLVGT